MVKAGMRWVLRTVAVLGAAVLLNNGTGRADDEKTDPLREELLKLNSVTGEEAQRTKLVALAKDKEKAKKLVTEAGKMLKEAKGKENPFNYNGAFMIARLAHHLKQYDVAEPFYERMVEAATKLKSGSKMASAYEGLIGLCFSTKKYARAAELCEEYVTGKGPEYAEDKEVMLELWIQALAKDEKFDEALKLVDRLIEDKDTAWYFLQLKGQVLREQGKLPAAIEAYVESLDQIDGNKAIKPEAKDRLKDRARYTLTGLYVDNKQIDKAAKELQTLIKRHPDSATYKNDLGFIWCDHDMNLEESEKLIKEALDLDKKEKEKDKEDGKIDEVKPNAAYLDSLGWVLFKQKKYKEALEPLKQAAYLDSLGWVLFKQKKYKEALEPLKQAAADEEDGSHLEIWDHLADCYMALGQKKDAIATWEKGLKFEDISKRDNERRRKVSDKLKKARAGD